MQEPWNLHIFVGIRARSRHIVLVVPSYDLRVSINFYYLEIVLHNETNIVVGLAIINIFDIVVNGGIGLVPRHGCIGGSYLV